MLKFWLTCTNDVYVYVYVVLIHLSCFFVCDHRYLDDLLDLGTRWSTDFWVALSLHIALDSHRCLDFQCLEEFSDSSKDCWDHIWLRYHKGSIPPSITVACVDTCADVSSEKVRVA